MRVRNHRDNPVGGRFRRWGMPVALLATLAVWPASAAQSVDIPVLAHASPESLTLTQATPQNVQVVNDTATSLTVTGIAVIPPADAVGGGGVFTVSKPAVVNGANGEGTTRPGTVIPPGGWLQLQVRASDPTKDAEATLSVAVRAPGASGTEIGQTVKVALRSGAASASVSPAVTEWDISVIHNSLRFWFLPADTIVGADMPVKSATGCTGKEVANGIVSSDGDAVRVTAICPSAGAVLGATVPGTPTVQQSDSLRVEADEAGGSQTVHLALAGIERNGVTYTGTLRLGADEKSDVKITLHRSEGLALPLVVLLLSILAGLWIQRVRGVTSVVEEQRWRLTMIESNWAETSYLKISQKVRAKKAYLEKALDQLKKARTITLKESDKDLVKIVADIDALEQLRKSWNALLSVGRQLESAAAVQWQPPNGLPDNAGNSPKITHEARELLKNPTEPDVDAVDDTAKKFTGLLTLLTGSMPPISEDIIRLHGWVMSRAAKSDERQSLLNELDGAGCALWLASSKEEVDAVAKTVRNIRTRVLRLPAETTPSLYALAGVGPLPAFPTGEGGTATFVSAPLAPPLPASRPLTDSAHAQLFAAAEAPRAFRTTELKSPSWIGRIAVWAATLMVFGAIAGLGLKATWFGEDFGQAVDWVGLVVWGLLTPTSVEVLISLVDKMRSSGSPAALS